MRRFFMLDKYNTWADWRLTLTSKEITEPEVKTHYVQLDGVHGSLDFTTALTGEPAYNDRTIKASFMRSEGTYEERKAVLREITAALHGKQTAIIEPDDPDHYFVGRIKVIPGEHKPAYSTLSVEVLCEPWRYAINETERLVVLDEETPRLDVVIVNNGVKTLCPVLEVNGTFIAHISSRLTVEQNVPLTEGTYKLPDLRLTKGINVVGLVGAGFVRFTYREATL